MKRCVQAMVITPNAPIATLRLENILDMAFVSRVGWRVCPSCLASTTVTQPNTELTHLGRLEEHQRI